MGIDISVISIWHWISISCIIAELVYPVSLELIRIALLSITLIR